METCDQCGVEEKTLEVIADFQDKGKTMRLCIDCASARFESLPMLGKALAEEAT